MVLEQEWSLHILQKVDFFMSQDCEGGKLSRAGTVFCEWMSAMNCSVVTCSAKQYTMKLIVVQFSEVQFSLVQFSGTSLTKY